MKLNYRLKEIAMCQALESYQAPAKFRSKFKGAPIALYEEVKRFIDFTKYFVMFRGPRNRGASSTRKRDAKAFDVYQRDARTVREIRIELEAFHRGVQWANNRSH